MDDLVRLADLIRERNTTEAEITRIIGRPGQIGHVGEYIASRVFRIVLTGSATQKGYDGHFEEGPLQGRNVNIKWYAKLEGILDLQAAAPPEYYLVLAGPRTPPTSSRGTPRPWLIDSVFLFEAMPLHQALAARGLKPGIATSVSRALWDAAEVYPEPRNTAVVLTEAQRAALALFARLPA